MARKNVEYTEYLYVWNITTNLPVTGDAANITLYKSQDGGAAAVTTNACAEVDAVNMKGVYKIVLTAAEMNYNSIAVAGSSTTANVQVNPVFLSTEDIKGDTISLLADTATLKSDTTDILVDTGAIISDVGDVYTDTQQISADTTTIISDVGDVYTDTQQIATDTTTIISDVGDVYTDTQQIISDVSDVKAEVDKVVVKLPASGLISNLNLDDVIDGAKLRTILGLMKARVLNKYLINSPASGDITFYKDDSSTVFARVNVTESGRTKTSYVDL